MPYLEEIIRLDKEASEARCRPKEVAVLPMKLVDALYIAINALDPIGEQYSREDKQRAKSEIEKVYEFLYGGNDFSVVTRV